MNSDVAMSDANLNVDNEERQPIRHFVVAVDFGTAFSSVAYAAFTHEYQRRYLDLNHVELIDQYPDWSFTNAPIYDVSTELWYPSPGQRQDGTQSFYTQEQAMGGGLDDEENESGSDTDSDHTTQQSEAPTAPMNSGVTPPLYWGYSVQRQVQIADAFDNSKRIARFKLLLHDSPETEKGRIKIEETCAVLRKTGLIKDNTDCIAHYLEQLFKHTHERLIKEGYTEDSKVEFVLCVPPIWKARASRQMHAAMSRAIQNSGFGTLQNGSIDNLFIVAEPEAAATTAVQSGKVNLQTGQTVLILDAGGATVDAATYTVDENVPLRFKTETVELKGVLCGSSYINERFEDLLVKRLSDEHYLKRDGQDMSRVIDGLVVEFEKRDKRALDNMFPDSLQSYHLIVEGLKRNRQKHLHPNRMRLSRDDIRSLFVPSAEGVAQLMKDQIDAARSKTPPCHVQKVILMGGYGQSKSLAAHLTQVLSTDPRYQGIELRCPRLMSTAVSQGAVLRALRKEEGPNRILQSSYGFLRSEHYMDKEEFKEAHKQQEPWRDPTDGLQYIENTIRWEIHKGTTIPAETILEREVEYTFAIQKKNLICKETLFVSDRYPEPGVPDAKLTERESHYRYNHPKNTDAEVVGEVEFDVTHLKNTDMVKKIPAPARGMFPYWKVLAKLLIIVNGRNLRYEVRLRNESGEAEARVVGSESLASAFKPGTE